MKQIHPFPARMAPEIIDDHLHDLKKSSVVLDPLAGSGTVPRMALTSGHTAIASDLDPLAILMTRVGTRRTHGAHILETAQDIVSCAMKRRTKAENLPWIRSCRETIDFVRFWFAEPQRNALARLILEINESDLLPRNQRDLYFLAVSKTIITKHVGASLAWDVSHSRPHKVRTENDFDVYEGFLRAVSSISNVMADANFSKSARVRKSDARNLSFLSNSSVDCVITSPPYLNAIDYMRGHKLSLVWFGFTIPQLRAIRSTSVGAERRITERCSQSKLLREMLTQAPEGILPIDQHKPFIDRYVIDAFALMLEFARIVKRGGQIVLVTANSFVRGTEVDTAEIYRRGAEFSGLTLSTEYKREIPQNRRYLPMYCATGQLSKRMKIESVQVYSFG